jgi:hypothetical protein
VLIEGLRCKGYYIGFQRARGDFGVEEWDKVEHNDWDEVVQTADRTLVVCGI